MSGHSKWANIKNRKGTQDKKRGDLFTKVARNILTAIRMGGRATDIEVNSFLKAAIEKAKEVNMPKENIERLLWRFEERKANLATYIFEGYGHGGVPILVEVESDNKNRILSELKFVMKEFGGSFGESGSVMFQFKKVGELELVEPVFGRELELIDLGAKEIIGQVILVEPEELNEVVEKLKKIGFSCLRQERVMSCVSPVLVDDEGLLKMNELIDELESNEEVVRVFAGFKHVKKV